jgi:hypothetical protein
MIFNRRVYVVVFVLVCCCKMVSQSFKLQKSIEAEEIGVVKIKWHAPVSFQRQGTLVKTLSFDGSSPIEEKGFLPCLFVQEACKQGVKLQPTIEPVLTETLSAQEETCINKAYITANFDIIESSVKPYRKVSYMCCKVVPLRINKTTGKLEKLVSYRIQWQPTSEPLQTNQRNGNQTNKTQAITSSSVLANGTWFKIGTAQNAIYKIDKTMLQNMGFDVAGDPRNIKIYGNGGEILSEANSDFHYDDLSENAIFIQGEADGSFDANDYILFYGQSPHKWKYNAGNNVSTRYSRNKHYYSDSVFYFITLDNSSYGKRITPVANAAAPVTNVVNSFDDYQVHENDVTNIVTSGREFYGENFDNVQNYSFPFSFPNLQNNDTVWLQTDLVGRRVLPLPSGEFDISYPGVGSPYSMTFPPTGSDFDSDVAEPGSNGSKYFIYTNGGTTIDIGVNRIYPDETGWLNYIWLIVRRALTMTGNQMTFRDYRCIGANAVSQFNLQSTSPTLRIWNVSNQFNITEQQITFASNSYSFAVVTDSLKQFIAFDGTSYQTPAFVGQVTNQNLHALVTTPADYIIIAPQEFAGQAKKLGDLHQANENLTYVIVTPDEIYNEFSSGVQDIMAIRQFIRMYYKYASRPPQYALLLGTGSYRQKDRYDPSNTVLVPTFETYNSWSFTNSKTGDDFYAFLDDNDGLISVNGDPDGLIDIGVGRLVVKNSGEATAVTNKIEQYYNRVEPTSSCCDQATQNTPDWRNWISLIADDANPGASDETAFFYQQESNATLIQQSDPRYNIDKIYEDAYQVETVPGGRRYPDVNTAINNRIAKGALIMGYSGHGDVLELSHEEIITIGQIEQWNNINNMPLFFTATCEFSRYDDPTLESAGEDILLNPNGGGIGLFTTTRVAYIPDGSALGPYFYSAAIDSLVNGRRPTLGDIIRITKSVPARAVYLHFALLGDPALTLSYPKQHTSPVKINAHNYTLNVNDTLSAIGKYTVTGFVSDSVGNKLPGFNGNIYISVFDKPSVLTTLNNSQNTPASSYIFNFNQQKSVLYKGNATVSNGNFSYSFIVPKDIMYNFGYGKISYYAQAGNNNDASGYYGQIIVGGTSNTPIIDNQGPGIKLFMNDDKFVSGGTTNQNPFIYAMLSDSSGVNTTGNGLGHDITAILDANTPHETVLNDYYQADLNRYQSGKILYQLHSLPNGNHTLSLKVWDVLDNSSTSSTDFVVAQNAQVALTHVLNYPNPFTTSTKFYVEHNQSCDFLNIEVQIFTITGKLVKTLLQTVENQGFRTDGINWDGKDDYGDKLARGVYIYKVTVKNSEGSKADKIEKLVILN